MKKKIKLFEYKTPHFHPFVEVIKRMVKWKFSGKANDTRKIYNSFYSGFVYRHFDVDNMTFSSTLRLRRKVITFQVI